MKTLEQKVQRAKTVIQSTLEEFKNPIISCSFGKDSMIVLSLLREMGKNLPVLFLKEPFHPSKLEFANSIIRNWQLTSYDYTPSSTSVSNKDGVIEIMNYYQAGKGFIWLPTGIKDPVKDKPFLCGLRDIYNKPLGNYQFPWDLLFVGSKSSDIDPIMGPMPMEVDLVRSILGPSVCCPIREFTDQDAWNFIELNSIPYNTKRYDKDNDYREFEDIDYNNDYYHACINCMDSTKSKLVNCPLTKTLITNIGAGLRHTQLVKPKYVRELSHA